MLFDNGIKILLVDIVILRFCLKDTLSAGWSEND